MKKMRIGVKSHHMRIGVKSLWYIKRGIKNLYLL